MEENKLKVHTMAEYLAEGKVPEVLFWVGCAGSFDDRAKKITKAFVKILNSINIDFAVLGLFSLFSFLFCLFNFEITQNKSLVF